MSTDLLAFADDFAALFCTTARQTLKVALGRTCQMNAGNRLPGMPASSEISVDMTLKEGGTGKVSLLLDHATAAVLCDLMMMGDGSAPWSEEHRDALQELGNQLAGAVSTGQSERWRTRLVFSASVGAGVPVPESASYPVVLELQGLPPREIVLAIDPELQAAIRALDENRSAQSDFPSGDAFHEGVEVQVQPSTPGVRWTNPASEAAPVVAPSASQAPSLGAAAGMQSLFIDSRDPSVQRLLDVPIDIQIELGQTELSIRRILEIGPGSIIELDRMAGEPVDLVVNDKVIARGEVVVIEENFGIRITQLVGPDERGRAVR